MEAEMDPNPTREIARPTVQEALAHDFAVAMTQERIKRWHESKVRRQILHRNIGKLGRGKKAVGGRYE